MRVDSTLQKFEVYVVATVAVLLVSGIAFFFSSPFSPQDYGLTDVSAQSSPWTSSAASQDSQPALLEPALRSLDGVAHHG